MSIFLLIGSYYKCEGQVTNMSTGLYSRSSALGKIYSNSSLSSIFTFFSLSLKIGALLVTVSLNLQSIVFALPSVRIIFRSCTVCCFHKVGQMIKDSFVNVMNYRAVAGSSFTKTGCPSSSLYSGILNCRIAIMFILYS